jgi:hypothetical protein
MKRRMTQIAKVRMTVKRGMTKIAKVERTVKTRKVGGLRGRDIVIDTKREQ